MNLENTYSYIKGKVTLDTEKLNKYFYDKNETFLINGGKIQNKIAYVSIINNIIEKIALDKIKGKQVNFTKVEAFQEVGGFITHVSRKGPNSLFTYNIKTNKQVYSGEHKLNRVTTSYYGSDFIFKEDVERQEMQIDMDKYKKMIEGNPNHYPNYSLLKGYLDKGNDNKFYLVSVSRKDAGIQNINRLNSKMFHYLSIPLEVIVVEGDIKVSTDITTEADRLFMDLFTLYFRADELPKY